MRSMLKNMLCAAGALLAVGLAGAATAAELVVIEAKGSSLQVGATIDGSKPLTLEDGARVTLVGADGTTIKLKGPFTGKPAGDGAADGNRVAESLAQLVSGREANTASLGAVRAGNAPPELPEPWVVDATTAGNACLREGQPAVLWRPSATEEQEMTLSPADRSWAASSPWPAGEAFLSLPAEVPFGDGESFLVDIGGTTTALVIQIMPSALATPQMQSAWLATKGCDRQLKALTKLAGK